MVQRFYDCGHFHSVICRSPEPACQKCFFSRIAVDDDNTIRTGAAWIYSAAAIGINDVIRIFDLIFVPAHNNLLFR